MEVSHLRASRRAHRAHLTRVFGKIASILESDEAPNERDAATLQTSLEQIEAKKATLTELDAKILATISDATELETEILDSEEIIFTLAEKISFIKAVQSRPKPLNVQAPPFQPLSVQSPTPASDSVSDQQGSDSVSDQQGSDSVSDQPGSHPASDQQSSEATLVTNTTQQQPRETNEGSQPNQAQGYVNTFAGVPQNVSRLPKLTLPTFGGDPLKWQTFWDSFDSAVHSNNVLTNVQKLNYLRAHLEGEAARTIAGFPLTSVNYQQSVDLLKGRFGDQQRIVNAHMHALMNLPLAKNNITSLRGFHDAIESHVRGLSALGQATTLYGALLVPMILGKLPVDIRKNLAREHSSLEWTLDKLREAITKEIRVLEAGAFVPPSQFEDHHSTASFHTGALSRHEPRKLPKCVFCKGSHPATQCDSVSDQSKRIDIVKRDKLCFNCLGHHRVSQCQSKGRCKHCKERHHTSLCRGTHNPQTPSNTQKPASEQPSVPPTQASQNLINSAMSQPQLAKVCFLKTAVATVRANNYSAQANILLDEGAQRSFITQTLANSLHLNTQRTERIAIAAFGTSEASNQTLPIATIQLQTTEGTEIPISVLVTPRIAQPLRNLPFSYVKQLSYLKGLQLNHAVSDSGDINISMLIGADAYWSIVKEAVIRGPGPTAVESKLGFLLSGPLYNYTPALTSGMFHLSSVSLYDSTDFTNSGNVWETDSEQISHLSTFLQEYLRDSVTRQSDGTYLVNFPWKSNHPVLPTNKSTCERRVQSLTRKLSKTPELLKVYNGIIEEQLRRDFIEKVPDSDLSKPCHYIPHHGVHKDSTTTPLRIIYDCSSREAKHLASLNDCLETGPPFLQELPAILLRFRSRKFGVSADIEKAFLHVQLHPKDRDFTRFLWPCNPDDPESPLQTYRFKVVLFGSASSPFMLYAALHCHLTQCSSTTAKDLLHNLYVDNILSGCSTEEEAILYYTEARTTLSEANFNLRSWASNSKQVCAAAERDHVADNSEQVNTLGLVWNTSNDSLSLTQKAFPSCDSPVTKREVLQQSSKIFDPLGFTSPVTISTKLLLQQLWQKKLSWDDPLPPEHQQQWQTLLQDLEQLHIISIPRCYLKNGLSTAAPIELHIFCDASTKAYGAVAYFHQHCESSFVISKTRVAPLKQHTLPRLELMGATVAAQMYTWISSSINYKIDVVHMWCDSQIVLHWLNSDKRLKQFVSNRVSSITEACPAQWWGYCPSADNPADLLTRGISLSALRASSMWTHGPEWIVREELRPQWSTTDIQHVQLTVAETEVLSPNPVEETSEDNQLSSVATIIDIERYSTLSKLLYVTAYVLRFIECIKSHGSKPTGPITAGELSKAQNMWIQSCQHSTYLKEINSLHRSQTSTRRLPLVRQLRLFLDSSNFLRCGGRIHNAPVDHNTKFPYLLPENHRLTTLIVYATHATQLHGGTHATVTALRQCFWIPAARRVVAKLLRKCVICRRVAGKPFPTPDPPPLLLARVQDGPPFSVTGVDFTGAMYVKSEGATGEYKVYVCLFTCASTRAVHLEVVTNLTEETFLQAFRRFTARRSLPRLIISDNASTYASAAKELNELFQSRTLQSALTCRGTTWKFIPKRAPWYGGFWERLVGMVKMSLKKTLGRAFITLNTLQTTIVEVEAVLNDRPLTYLPSSTGDLVPLTPSHLLYGRRIIALPHPDVQEEEIADPDYPSAEQLRSKVDRQGLLLQHFVSRWKKEYLTSLRERHRTAGSMEQTVKTGDVVQIHDDIPRSRWKLGAIEELVKGNDGYIRSVTVRTASGRTNRPIARLYPLEVEDPSTDVEPVQQETESTVQQNTDQVSPRHPRAAAVRARKQLSEWTETLRRPPEDVEIDD